MTKTVNDEDRSLLTLTKPSLTLCPRLPRMGGQEAPGVASLESVWVWVGESIHPTGVRP